MNAPVNKRELLRATSLGAGAIAGLSIPAQAAPFSTFAYAASGEPTSRTTPDRLADIINVKDYGAKGDGVTGDGAAIQAAFDAAYGPASSPHGGSFTLNKGVFFPAGTYLVDQQLFLNNVQGAWLFGAGQSATRLLYTGPASKLPSGDVTSLLTCRTVTYSHIEGITFDVTSSNAIVGVQLMNFAAISNDGTGNSWVDCGFVGASSDGFLCTTDGSGQLGSEEFFLGCLFDSCTSGLLLNSGNGLDYTFIGCKFNNCISGINCPVGAINTIAGCSFNNTSFASFTGSISGTTLTVSGGSGLAVGQRVMGTGVALGTTITAGSGASWTVSQLQTVGSEAMTASALDIWIKQQQCPAIIGCRSTSPNFCLAGPVKIVGCYHNPAVAGGIWNGKIDNQDKAVAILDGCLGGANSGVYGNTGHLLYLRGNTFNNATPLANFGGTVVENI